MHVNQTKIGKIINEEFDMRMSTAVIAYIINTGWENIEEITDEYILEIKSNGFMDKSFIQAMVRAAVRICKECGIYEDFIPYIKKYVFIENCKTEEVALLKCDYSSKAWKRLLHDFDIEEEEDEDGNLVMPDVINGYFIKEE